MVRLSHLPKPGREQVGQAMDNSDRVRSPSFVNLTGLGEMCKGHKVADAIVILGAIDVVMGEVDR